MALEAIGLDELEEMRYQWEEKVAKLAKEVGY
jgi:hypothetical protein